MTREILFKGKRLDNGEWVEGNLITGTHWLGKNEIAAIVPLDNTFYPRCEITCWFEVDPSTVGRFLGLTDKNGKKIFEGDIIEGDNGHISAIAKVEYGSYRPDMFFDLYRNEFGYVPSQNLYGYYLESKKEQMLVVDSPYMAVIGNIHDNPELLEGEG